MLSGRSCDPRGGPHACVIVAHDALSGEELWRRRLIPGPGEFGDETWGDVPFEERGHVGSWMVPSFDPELNLVGCGSSSLAAQSVSPAAARQEAIGSVKAW